MDIYWQAQWAIGQLEEARQEFGEFIHENAIETALDTLMEITE